MRKTIEMTCISCPMGCGMDVTVEVKDDDKDEIVDVDGNLCPAGIKYAKEEYHNPTRVLPTTARVKGGVLPLVPVKSDGMIPKGLLEDAMEVIAKAELEAPVKLGDVVVENILDTGVDIVATRDMDAKEE